MAKGPVFPRLRSQKGLGLGFVGRRVGASMAQVCVWANRLRSTTFCAAPEH